jgi:hypothetical protein
LTGRLWNIKNIGVSFDNELQGLIGRVQGSTDEVIAKVRKLRRHRFWCVFISLSWGVFSIEEDLIQFRHWGWMVFDGVYWPFIAWFNYRKLTRAISRLRDCKRDYAALIGDMKKTLAHWRGY